jgi:hypothetical protein
VAGCWLFVSGAEATDFINHLIASHIPNFNVVRKVNPVITERWPWLLVSCFSLVVSREPETSNKKR